MINSLNQKEICVVDKIIELGLLDINSVSGGRDVHERVCIGCNPPPPLEKKPNLRF